MNCLLYARVSTDKQAQKDLSIPAQIAAMKGYIKTNGWKIAGHFVDEGESARTADRPELKNLLQYCKDHKDVNVVLVHKIDRLARNLVDYATIKAILKQRGIRLVSVSEPFDDNPVGHLLENIIASISEWYSANLGEEIKKASFAKLNKGEWPHKPPIGYRSIKDENNRVKHVPDSEASALVLQAFQLFSTGNYSLLTLSEEMYDRGLRTRYGRMLSREAMKKLLMRKFYIGRLEWQGKQYHGIHQPIVPKDLFYRVQEVLKSRSADTGEKGRLRFLLRGVAYCRTCDQRLTGEVHPRGSYYRCLHSHDKTKCDQPYVPVKHLDDQLVDLYTKLQPPKKLLVLLKHEIEIIAKNREKLAEREIKGVQKALEDLENKELQLLDEMLTGKADRAVYARLQERYTTQKTQLEARLSQMEVDYRDPLDFLDKCILISSMLLFLHQKFDFEERKDLLKAIFERIYVEDKTIVSVKLNPPFSILLGGELDRLFKDHPPGATKEDVFEQVLRAVAYDQRSGIRALVDSLAETASR